MARFNRRLRAAHAVNRAAADRFAALVLPIITEIPSCRGPTPDSGLARRPVKGGNIEATVTKAAGSARFSRSLARRRFQLALRRLVRE